MTEDFIETHFLNLATRAKYIAHTEQSPSFFRIKSKVDTNEFDNAVRSTQKSVVLLLELGAGSLIGMDSPGDHARIGLHCLVKTDEDFINIKAARALAKANLIKVVASMRRDCESRYQYSDNSAGPLKSENIDFDGKCKYDDMDGIDGNWYGKCLYFDWKQDVSMVYDPNDYIL